MRRLRDGYATVTRRLRDGYVAVTCLLQEPLFETAHIASATGLSLRQLPLHPAIGQLPEGELERALTEEMGSAACRLGVDLFDALEHEHHSQVCSPAVYQPCTSRVPAAYQPRTSRVPAVYPPCTRRVPAVYLPRDRCVTAA